VAALRGKVVIVDFWTYTCINWRRTLPYVAAWAEKYRDQGLVVIGVHTPEFGFEKDLDNVRRETSALKVRYPVAVDSDYPSGVPSVTSIGPRCISPTRRDASGTTSSVKAVTGRSSGRSSNF
jgi:thiol-disulfide isomerase/thioredoxin